MRKSINIATPIRRFFEHHLISQRSLSTHTVLAYRDTIKLFLQFSSQQYRKSCVDLSMEDLTEDIVRKFLDHLEHVRNNTVRTRNHRLAAIHSFFRYSSTIDPRLLYHCQAVLNVPFKRQAQPVLDYLEREEILHIFSTIDSQARLGLRDDAPRILHLATHGFFLNDLDFSDLMDERLDRGIQVSMALKETGKKIKIDNPLLRSGIALAGANNTLKHGNTEKSDGIVTAEKILGLRLRGTDMVVLSACDTGIGEVKTGEGVFGLRRSFTQAGTKSLVMSMWSVPDKETKELMVEFYKNIQSGKMNRCQALRQAALREMKIVKERYGYANPFSWGAFVFLGEP